MNLNPGLEGVFGGDMRFVFNYRNQWRTVPVAYETFSGSIENKFYFIENKKDTAKARMLYDRFITGGILFNHDKQGSLGLTTIQIGLPVSLTLPLGKRFFVTGAVMPQYAQRGFDTDEASFDLQYNGYEYDPSLPSKESQLMDNTRIHYFDLASGFNLRYQKPRKRTFVDYGVGYYHMNRPNHEFWSDRDDVRLQTRVNTYLRGVLQLTDRMDLQAQGVYQRQGGNQEIIYGIGGRLHLDYRRYHELALAVGVNFRHLDQDAVAPYIEVYYRTWLLGFSYDTNLSDFDVATDKRGGPELSLIYRLYRIKTMKNQACSML